MSPFKLTFVCVCVCVQALGDVWGYQETYYSWFSGVTDNALYPGIIYGATVTATVTATGTVDIKVCHSHK